MTCEDKRARAAYRFFSKFRKKRGLEVTITPRSFVTVYIKNSEIHGLDMFVKPLSNKVESEKDLWFFPKNTQLPVTTILNDDFFRIILFSVEFCQTEVPLVLWQRANCLVRNQIPPDLQQPPAKGRRLHRFLLVCSYSWSALEMFGSRKARPSITRAHFGSRLINLPHEAQLAS